MTLTPTELQNQLRYKNTKPRVYQKLINYDKQLEQGKSTAIVQLQYRYACNFHCSHCSVSGFRAEKGKRSFTLADVEDFSKQADEYGLAQIGISGGEPLVFKEFEKIVDLLDPMKFHLQLDTNGWFLDDAKAKYLKEIGIDKVQISLDGVNPEEHDSFRNKPGSYLRAIRAIESTKKAGLDLQVSTVVDHNRATSKEFIQFLELMKSMEAPVAVIFAKPVGEWAGRTDILLTPDDSAYIRQLEQQYNLYDHTTPGYGRSLGCVAVKHILSITKFGDIMPCPWMYFSLGNFFETPLADILAKGMRYFGEHYSGCRLSESIEFNEQYVSKTIGKPLPVPIEEIMGER